jgi:3-hydroxy-9,10-secoandrosta-1,3,5(10)-triene-9,17-dione monooxygenase reductase component
VFAGLRPSPGGMFARLEVAESEWGPVLTDLEDRAYCTITDREEAGYAGVVRGVIDRVEVTGTTDPLIYFRGRYHDLD